MQRSVITETRGTLQYFSGNEEVMNIQFAFADDAIYILFIHVEESYRNKGYSYFLIHEMVKVIPPIFFNYKTIVHVDDMSSRYRKQHNLYCNLGFEYINETHPEMSCSFMRMQLLLSQKSKPVFR